VSRAAAASGVRVAMASVAPALVAPVTCGQASVKIAPTTISQASVRTVPVTGGLSAVKTSPIHADHGVVIVGPPHADRAYQIKAHASKALEANVSHFEAFTTALPYPVSTTIAPTATVSHVEWSAGLTKRKGHTSSSLRSLATVPAVLVAPQAVAQPPSSIEPPGTVGVPTPTATGVRLRLATPSPPHVSAVYAGPSTVGLKECDAHAGVMTPAYWGVGNESTVWPDRLALSGLPVGTAGGKPPLVTGWRIRSAFPGIVSSANVTAGVLSVGRRAGPLSTAAGVPSHSFQSAIGVTGGFARRSALAAVPTPTSLSVGRVTGGVRTGGSNAPVTVATGRARGDMVCGLKEAETGSALVSLTVRSPTACALAGVRSEASHLREGCGGVVHLDSATGVGGLIQVRPGIVGPGGWLAASGSTFLPTHRGSTAGARASASGEFPEVAEELILSVTIEYSPNAIARLFHLCSIKAIDAFIETEHGKTTIHWRDGVVTIQGPERDRVARELRELAELWYEIEREEKGGE